MLLDKCHQSELEIGQKETEYVEGEGAGKLGRISAESYLMAELAREVLKEEKGKHWKYFCGRKSLRQREKRHIYKLQSTFQPNSWMRSLRIACLSSSQDSHTSQHKSHSPPDEDNRQRSCVNRQWMPSDHVLSCQPFTSTPSLATPPQVFLFLTSFPHLV